LPGVGLGTSGGGGGARRAPVAGAGMPALEAGISAIRPAAQYRGCAGFALLPLAGRGGGGWCAGPPRFDLVVAGAPLGAPARRQGSAPACLLLGRWWIQAGGLLVASPFIRRLGAGLDERSGSSSLSSAGLAGEGGGRGGGCAVLPDSWPVVVVRGSFWPCCPFLFRLFVGAVLAEVGLPYYRRW